MASLFYEVHKEIYKGALFYLYKNVGTDNK